MIIFGTRSKVLHNKTAQALGNCAYCGTTDTIFGYKQISYFHIFWIPVFPYKTRIMTVCNHCRQVRDQNSIDPQVMRQIQQDGLPKTSVGYFAGLIVLLLFVGSAVAAGISSSMNTDDYLKAPAVGDIYEIKHEANGKSYYTLYRIAKVGTDSIVFAINDYEAEGRRGLRKIKQQHHNSYSEQVIIARADVARLKAKRQIVGIDRE